MRSLRKPVERTADAALRRGASALSGVVTRFEREGEVTREAATPRHPPASGVIGATAHWSAPHRLPFLADFIVGLERQAVPFSAAIYVNGPRRSHDLVDELHRLLEGKADVTIRVVTEPQLVDAVLPVARSVSLVDCRLRGNPYRLTWQHKKLFRDLTLAHQAFDDVGALVYSEDDMALAAQALTYWHAYRPPLAETGLIPGFLRVEGPPDDLRVAGWPRRMDSVEPLALPAPAGVTDDDTLWFVPMRNPYQAMYVLDASLAEVHFAHSPFRSRPRSKLAGNHGARYGVPERAAIGPLFDPPLADGYRSRAVIPLMRYPDGRAVPYPAATVDHASRNYYEESSIPQSKQRVDEAFRLDF